MIKAKQLPDIPIEKVAGLTTELSNKVSLGTDGKVPVNQLPAIVGGNIPLCKIYHNVNQSVPSATSTYLSFNSELYDNDNMHDNAIDNGRIYIKESGMYLINATVAFTVNSTGMRALFVTKNHSAVVVSNYQVATVETYMTATGFAQLNAGDYIEASVYQSSGTTLNVLASGDAAPSLSLLKVNTTNGGVVDGIDGLYRNAIINGNFDIWQRGTSQTTSGYGSDDRWLNQTVGSTKVHSRQGFSVGQMEVPNNPTYFSRTEVTSVAGDGNYTIKYQKIEDVTKLAGKTVTVSFWAKADSNKNMSVELYRNFGSGGSSPESICVKKVSLTTSWQKFTMTSTIPSVEGKTIGTANNIQVVFWFEAGASWDSRTDALGQQNGIFDIAQVQLNEGNIDIPYLTRTFDEELRMCQRYYEKSYNQSTAPGTATSVGCVISGAPNPYNINSSLIFKVTKRIIPTIKIYSTKDGAAGYICDTGGSPTNKAVSASDTSENSFTIYGANTLSTGTTYRVQWAADAEL